MRRPGAQESLFLDEHAAWKGSEMKRTDDVMRERVQGTERPYLDLGFDLTSEPDASLLPLLLDAKNEFDFSLPGLATRPLPANKKYDESVLSRSFTAFGLTFAGCTDVGRRAPFQWTAAVRLNGNFGWNQLRQRQQRLEQLGHVVVVLGRAFHHFHPARTRG